MYSVSSPSEAFHCLGYVRDSNAVGVGGAEEAAATDLAIIPTNKIHKDEPGIPRINSPGPSARQLPGR